MPSCSLGNVKIHVEVLVCLLFFAFTLSGSIKTNLIIFRTCYVTLGYNETECSLLGTPNENNEIVHLEKLVQPYASVISMVHSVIDSIFTVIICLFAGPWSDRFGRRPLIIFPSCGYLIHFSLLAIFAAFKHLSPWYSVLTSIPVLMTGGSSSLITGILCYISDVTTHEQRGVRMGWFEVVIIIGIFSANLSASYLLEMTSYPVVFLVSAGSCLIALMFAIFLVPESLAHVETENRFKGLFKMSNVKEMIKTTLKKRSKYDRFTIIACIVMLTTFIVMLNGEGSVVFLYLRTKFQWSLEKFTLFSAVANVLGIVGAFVGIYGMHKCLKIPESLMIWVALMSLFTGALLQGLAKEDWVLYTAASTRVLGTALSPMARSLLSKIIPNEEAGKIFAFITTSEGLFGMIGSPLFTAIYNATLQSDPSIFNYVSAGVYFSQILLSITIIVLRSKRSDPIIYEELGNEQLEAAET